MKLVQVFYELYRSDAAALEGHEDDELHAVDREIRLCFEDSSSVWLSWNSKPRQFCVGYQGQPYFVGPIDKIVEMTNSFMWRRIVDKDIAINYRESEHQLLEISTKSNSVWCWAEGVHGSDVLHISTQHPVGT